ncbi:hypothetical protein RUM44_009044 [Polyplax serrata]|uniref:Adenosine kinase n=1 Tax=Polyplax serrata TaxID=468196 RepID=A0ABR1ARM0_POLSC
MEKGQLLGIGNPLLDLTVTGDAKLLEKYKLEANNAVIANEFQKSIYKDLLENYDVQFTAGGSVQNSLRVCQWIVKESRVCIFMGSVGMDKYSKILQQTAESDGVEVRYQYHEDIPTGTCAAIITTHEGNKRSLCANLAAAEKFTIDHILKPDNYRCIEKANIYYISGFFLTVSLETVLKIGETAAKENKFFITNLSAPFICDLYKDSVMKTLYYTDVVFGNESELQKLGEGCFKTKNLEEIMYKMANLPKANMTRERIVIITNGCHPVLYVQGKSIKKVEVPKIPEGKVIDTNGAGDAFAGGFLSQFLMGKSIEKCIQCGVWAAGQIIQNHGCSFNKDVQYN